MALAERVIHATPAQVSAALADGWSYADWVVGAVHVRDVDGTWPAPNSRVHHCVGAWPVTIADSTSVRVWDADGRMELVARLWPFGEASVTLTWEQTGSGGCRVRMAETFERGPLLAARNRLGDLLLHARNAESLRRLDDLTRRYPSS
jgi:hypothetical protein